MNEHGADTFLVKMITDLMVAVMFPECKQLLHNQKKKKTVYGQNFGNQN